jgi:hypothetical protein
METRIVPFYGDQLQAVKDDRGIWAGVTSMCEGLGLESQAQLRRLHRSPWAKVAMTAILAQDGRTREVPALHLSSVPMWLATVQVSRVRPELREKLARYQCEAAEVLARAFLPSADPSPAAVLSVPDLARVVIHEVAEAVRLNSWSAAGVLSGLRAGLEVVAEGVGRCVVLLEKTHAEVVKIRRRQAAGGRGTSGLSRRDRRRRRAKASASQVESEPLFPPGPTKETTH